MLARVVDGELWVVDDPELRGISLTSHSDTSGFSLGTLPTDGDYRLFFMYRTGSGRKSYRRDVNFHTGSDFQVWARNPEAAAAATAERERERTQDEARKVRYLMKVANYKHRSFGLLSQGAMCRGCGFRYRDGLHGPDSVRELLRDHQFGCHAQALMKEVVEGWNAAAN